MINKGLIHGVLILIITAFSALITSFISSREVKINIIIATAVISWLVAGYLYKKNIGNLVLSKDRKAFNNLIKYSLGAGIIWGPTKLLVTSFPLPEVNSLVNITTALISVPLTGFSILGILLFGSMFCKIKTKSLTNRSS